MPRISPNVEGFSVVPPQRSFFHLGPKLWNKLPENVASCVTLPAFKAAVKGCGMGTLFVLVSPCFRENVVVTGKSGSFLCSLDNLLQKNVIVLFFGNQIPKWRSFEKRAILTYFSHFLVTSEKLQKFLQHISHSHTHMYFAHLIDFLFALPILKKNTIYQVWFLFGMSPGADSYSRHFGAINK